MLKEQEETEYFSGLLQQGAQLLCTEEQKVALWRRIEIRLLSAGVSRDDNPCGNSKRPPQTAAAIL